jgi:protein transport protein SEC23
MLRVTTLANNWAPMNVTPQQLLQGFDQECAAVALARLAVWKATTEDMDALKWIDRHLIRFSKRFATYRKGDSSSYALPETMSVYPQFMFHLRRGVLVSVFGSSPDETVFFRHYLLREGVANALMMIQPVLDEYSLESPEPMPAMLSSASLKQNTILVLDTFFIVVVWTGGDVAAWRKANYHENPEYANIAALLNAPKEDAERTLSARFPYPLCVICDQGTSQARFLLAAVDPAPIAGPGATGQVVNTEDASLTRFMEHLAKFSVDPDDS